MAIQGQHLKEGTASTKTKIITIAALAVIIIVVVIFAIIQNNPDVASVIDSSSDGDDISVSEATVTEWPASQFENIPVFEADSYEVTKQNQDKVITITLDSSYLNDLKVYIATLKDSGAELYSEDDYSSILGMGDVEIHILKDETAPRIIFCAEDAVESTLDGFDNYPLLDSGRLTEARQDSDNAMTAYLTYRNVSLDSIKKYCQNLTDNG
jgi:hypothetical protein